MDGVIIDSEPMHARAAILALRNYDVQITFEYLQQYIGSTTYAMCKKMVNDFQLQVTPEDLFEANTKMKAHLLKKEGHTVIPYIIDVMKDLYKNGIKLIIASSSPAEAIEEVMNSLHISKYFDGYVSGMSIEHPKPAPDIFLAAAKKLDVLPEECIVIEDSFHGVSAACAAKIPCIGFLNPNSGNQDLRNATILVEGFDEIDYHFINNVYQYAYKQPLNVLTTDNFMIKELSVEDIEVLHSICMKPEVKPYLDDFDDRIEVEKEKHIAYIKNIYHYYGFGLWGVYFKNTNELVGRCGIELKILDQEEIYEIGYLLDPKYQGQGFAKEFVLDTLNYCFTELDIHRVVAVIDKTNLRSIHLAEQVGMKRYGECNRNHRDCYKYEIIYH